MQIRTLFTFIIVSISLTAGFSQTSTCTFTIRGRVVDSDTQLPLSGVTLKISPGAQQLRSDGHGYFRFSRLCGGVSYTLTATSVGFDSLITEVPLKKDETLTLKLHHGHILLHDVNVVGHQQTVATANPVRTV